MDWRGRGGYLRYVVIEELLSPENTFLYGVLLLTSWRNGYFPLALQLYRPRHFRNLDRLLQLIRRDFGYDGSVEVRRGGAPKKRRGGWTRIRPIAKGRDVA